MLHSLSIKDSVKIDTRLSQLCFCLRIVCVHGGLASWGSAIIGNSELSG